MTHDIYQKIAAYYGRCFKILKKNKWIICFTTIFFILSSMSGIIYQAIMIGNGPFEQLPYDPTGYNFFEQFSRVLGLNSLAFLLKILLGMGLGVGPAIGIFMNAFDGYASIYTLYAHNGLGIVLALYLPFIIFEEIASILSCSMGFSVFLSFLKKKFRKFAIFLSAGLGIVIYTALRSQIHYSDKIFYFELTYLMIIIISALILVFSIPLLVMMYLSERKSKFWNLTAEKKSLIIILNAYKEALLVYVFIIIPLTVIVALMETVSILMLPIFVQILM
jgi:hypothetical protein